MAKKRKKLSGRTILSIVTIALVAVVVWGARDKIGLAFTEYLPTMNLWFILALIPEQLFFYFTAGQMFFSYMAAKKNARKIPLPTLARISFELNFVNHAIPSGGVAGLGYIAWRLLPFGSSVGETTFMYVLRYIITICTKQLQVFAAIIILLCVGGMTEGAIWILVITSLVCLGVLGALVAIIVIASSQKRINKFTHFITRLVNWVVDKVTIGRKKDVLEYATIEKYFHDIHHNIVLVRKHKKMLLKPLLWGILYSFFEVAAFWLVAIGLGHPEIFPQIIVGDVLATIVGAVIPLPGGLGGFETVMIMVVSGLGVDAALATSVVLTTRVLILLNTIVSGYGFYQNAISKIGKAEKEKILSGQQ